MKLVKHLTFTVLILTSFNLHAKEVVQIPFQDWINSYLDGSVASRNYDALFTQRCNDAIPNVAVPANHRFYSGINNIITTSSYPDPQGRGYYELRHMDCRAQFINDSTDCTRSGGVTVYATGETYSTNTVYQTDCEVVTKTYTCNNTVWSKPTQTIKKITGCRPK